MERYYKKELVAYVRGALTRLKEEEELKNAVFKNDPSLLSDEELSSLIKTAGKYGIKTYYFKKSERILPRVRAVLGFLRGIEFSSLLDVGSGRGAFLIPFLDQFSDIFVTSLDILPKRVQMLSDMSFGGIDRLTVKNADICDTPLDEHSFDVVTMLEVLEHIPRVEDAIKNAVRIAKKHIVVSVPSREDDNPEHIHLLTRDRLCSYFEKYGVKDLTFSYVNGHLIMIASKENGYT